MPEMVVTPWEVKGRVDYNKLIKEFGIDRFSSILPKIKKPNMYMKRGIIFGHRDFGRILDCINNKKEFVIMTGLMPSGKFHIGHKLLVDQIVYYQSLGAKIFLCVADTEAYNTRNGSLEELRKVAVEEYLINYIALGLKPRNCDFYFQSSRSGDSKKSNAYYRLANMSAKYITFNEIKAIYGDVSSGKITSALLQVSDILHPQLKEFGGPKPVLVPVGIDQDPHLRLARDIAFRFSKEFNFIVPSSTYHEFMIGLKGGKMSSSDPTSYIALSDTPEEAERKIVKYAFSGGRETKEEHRKKGGIPEIDVAYNMLYFMFEPDDKKIKKIYDDYSSGALLTGELKQILIEKIKKFLIEHAKARKGAERLADKFL